MIVPKKKEKPRYYSYDDIQPSTNYTVSSFAGALGKLTHYSAKIPRQVKIFN